MSNSTEQKENTYIGTLPLVKQIAGEHWGKEYHGEDHSREWDNYYINGFHIKLEEADKKDDWEWVKENIELAEYFFLFHIRMTAFEWTNWDTWYHNWLCEQ